ncbi:MAG: caspase family protein [Nitrospiraceae bacterium]
MFTQTSGHSTWFLRILLGAVLAGACTPSIAPPFLTVPVKEQEVPIVLTIGPIDTSRLVYEGAPVGGPVESSIQRTLRDTLSRTNVFKDVVILNLPAQAGEKTDPEQILAAARFQHADLLLVGEVKEFQVESMAFLGSEYSVLTRLQLQLYNVHTGGLAWKKTENVKVAHEGSLQEIVLNVAVPSLSAGLLPPLIDHIQAEYLASLRGPRIAAGAVEPFGVFGGAELAKIDAELAPPAGMTPPKDHAYAVIVGIEDYRDLPKVDYAKRDAEMVRKYLVKALGYREQNIVTILNDRVTRSQLEARFEKWLPKQVSESRDAEVFVYYGGHGAPDPNTNQAFLVPYDGDPAYLETTAYPLKRLYQVLGDLPAKQVMLVLDSCFSGAGGRSVIAKGARPMLITVEDPLLASQNMVVLSAAAGNQISSAFPEKRHGLFTYYFLKGLQGEADANKDGAVDVAELYAYLKPQVETAASRMHAEQSPQLMPGTELLKERAKLRLVDLKR